MRKLLLPAVLAIALAIPVQAAAKTKRYMGAIAPAGAISFKVLQKRHSKKKRVGSFRFSGVPVTCAEGPKTTVGIVSTPVKLKKRRFNIVASNSVTGATLEVHGNLAAGTIRLSGNLPIEPSGQGTSCDSGVLGWTAHRG